MAHEMLQHVSVSFLLPPFKFFTVAEPPDVNIEVELLGLFITVPAIGPFPVFRVRWLDFSFNAHLLPVRVWLGELPSCFTGVDGGNGLASINFKCRRLEVEVASSG